MEDVIIFDSVEDMRKKGATRFDSAADASGYGAYLEEQVNKIDEAFQAEVLPPNDANFLVEDVQSSKPIWQNTLRYKRLEGSVKAKELSYRGDDVATVGVTGQEFSANVARPAAGMFIDRNEAEMSRVHGFDIDTFEAGTVRTSIEDYRRELVFNGIPKKGIKGFFGAGVVKSDDTYLVGGDEIMDLTGDQLLELFKKSTLLLGVNSKQTFTCTKLLIPSIMMYAAEVKKPTGSDGRSVLAQFLMDSLTFNSPDQIMASSYLNYRLDGANRRVASMVAMTDGGTRYVRTRRSGPIVLPAQNYLKGQLIAWEDNIGDVEITEPNAFRVVNLVGTDPDTFSG